MNKTKQIIFPIIILNSPPNSGKDTIGERLSELTGSPTARFKDHLYQCTATLFNVDLEWLKGVSNDRALKEIPHSLFVINGKEHLKLAKVKKSKRWEDYKFSSPSINISPRDALIYVSECVIKPSLGDDYFGKIAAEKIDTERGAIFTDGGFNDELTPVIEKHGKDRVLVVQFSRDGCSFDGDSRSYLDVPEGVDTVWMENNSSIDNFCEDVLAWVMCGG